MANMCVTHISSKGHIAIPQAMREDLIEGDKLVIAHSAGRLILKKIEDLKDVQDLEFAIRTEEAWRRVDRGEGVEMDFEDFLNEMKKW